MKLRFGRLVALVAFVILPTAHFAQDARASLTELSPLGGCWEMNIPDKQLVITEQWMKPAGGLMIGSGRTVKSGKAIDYEFLRITEEPDGIYYVAKPTANKEETRFKLIKANATELIFENPAHDFPQRVIYRRSGDRLNARIEGTSNGKSRGVDFPYTRVKCE